MATVPSGVLLFGGSVAISFLNDSWRFNTATNTWGQISISSPPPARYDHAMAVTPSGDVLLFGGFGNSGPLNDTWLFDTSTNSWRQLTFTTSTPPVRFRHAMAATQSGDVLLFGGQVDSSGSYLNDTWLFDTSTNTWTQLTFTTPTPSARSEHAMAATLSGDVLLFGGWHSGNLNDTWRFNTATNSWSQVSTSPIPPARCNHAMATTPSGNVLLFGGHGTSGGYPLNDTWLFDTATNSWSQVSTSPTPPVREWHAMAATPVGVLLFGGLGDSIAYFNDTWRYGQVSSTLHLLTGWNLASIPAVTDGAPNTVFAGLPTGWALYSWDGFLNRYASKLDTVLHVGTGFWLYVTGAIDYEVAGTPYTPNSLTIALANGWNIVGTPYPVRCYWTTVQFLYGGTTYVLDQAITNGWMGAGVYTWTGSGYGNAKSWFAPTYGYWIRSLVNGASLVFIRPP
jgi:N-acetylneuraminic acid mutarotase